MTDCTLKPHRPAPGLDAEDRRALAALAAQAAALAPFVGPALVVRLQLAALLVAYLAVAVAMAAGLAALPGRLLQGLLGIAF